MRGVGEALRLPGSARVTSQPEVELPHALGLGVPQSRNFGKRLPKIGVRGVRVPLRASA